MALLTLITAIATPAAVESVTETYAGMATRIHGRQGNNPAPSFIALPIVAPLSAAGTVTAKGTATLQDTNAQWSSGQFTGTNGAFYAEFDCGLIADIVGCNAATKTLTLPDTLPPAVAVGSSYRIRRHQTLASLLGANNAAGLNPGQNPSAADGVMLIMPQTQESRNFFYSNVPGFPGWFQDDYSPADQQVVYPEQGLIVRRKQTNDVVFCVNGAVKECPTLAPIFPGNNVVGTLSFCRCLRLSELNLYTTTPGGSLAAGDNPSAGDNVTIYTPDGLSFTYFYAAVPGAEGWYDWNFDPADSVGIDAGMAFIIRRKAPRAAFTWSIPTE